MMETLSMEMDVKVIVLLLIFHDVEMEQQMLEKNVESLDCLVQIMRRVQVVHVSLRENQISFWQKLSHLIQQENEIL